MVIGDTSKFFKTNKCTNIFLSELRKIPLLTVDEEEELMLKAKNGDKEAKNALTCGNIRFIYSLAKVYARDEDELMDYVNEGFIGLDKALEKFDPTLGYKFFTYGVWYIRREMNYYLMTKRDMVSRSAQIGQMSKKIDMVRQRYYAENGGSPSDDEIKSILKDTFDVEAKDVDAFVDSSFISIDDDVTDDYSVENSSIYNNATACFNDYEEEAERDDRTTEINGYLSVLNDNERDIVNMRFGTGGYERPCSDEEICEKYHISPPTLKKVVEGSLDKIRRAIKLYKTNSKKHTI